MPVGGVTGKTHRSLIGADEQQDTPTFSGTGDLRFPDTCQEDSSSTDPHVMPLEAACSDMDAVRLSF